MLFSVFLFPIFFISYFLLSMKIGRRLGINTNFSIFLFLWHTGFCFLYYYMTDTIGGDILGYWNHSLVNNYDFSPGTAFVTSLTKIFSDGLGLNISSTLLFYNFWGLVGLLLLAHILLNIWPYKDKLRRYIPYFILLLPGMSFWTSVIGKDSLAFFAVCLAIYSSINFKKRYYLFIISAAIMLAVRPHIAAIMLISMALSSIFEGKLPIIYRFGIVVLLSIAGSALIPFALSYSGLGDAASISDASDYIEKRQSYNQEGGGGLDISSMSIPEQFFAYLFRPLFFDSPGALGIIVSFENLFILVLFLLFLLKGIKKIIFHKASGTMYNLIFLIIGLTILATTTANLGISIRQKTMLLPSLFYLIALSAYYIKNPRMPKYNQSQFSRPHRSIIYRRSRD